MNPWPGHSFTFDPGPPNMEWHKFNIKLDLPTYTKALKKYLGEPMPHVYLAGPIRGQTIKQSCHWRGELTTKLLAKGIDVWDPMRHKPWLTEDTMITADYPEYVLGSGRAILERDVDHDVWNSDLVLVNLLDEQPNMVGSFIEVGAAYAWGIPIVIVIQDDPNHIYNHGMLLATTPYIVRSLDQAVPVIEGILS